MKHEVKQRKKCHQIKEMICERNFCLEIIQSGEGMQPPARQPPTLTSPTQNLCKCVCARACTLVHTVYRQPHDPGWPTDQISVEHPVGVEVVDPIQDLIE